jgi:hypothetical protein
MDVLSPKGYGGFIFLDAMGGGNFQDFKRGNYLQRQCKMRIKVSVGKLSGI